jgi:hypothetical protein
LASELWPIEGEGNGNDQDEQGSDDEEHDLSIEAQIANELASIKRPRKEQRFSTYTTVLRSVCCD